MKVSNKDMALTLVVRTQGILIKILTKLVNQSPIENEGRDLLRLARDLNRLLEKFQKGMKK